jgi:hypothetical protein
MVQPNSIAAGACSLTKDGVQPLRHSVAFGRTIFEWRTGPAYDLDTAKPGGLGLRLMLVLSEPSEAAGTNDHGERS